MRLLDTDIMIDVLRAYPPAVVWLESLDDDGPALPGFVALELMQGCRNKMEMKRLLKRLQSFQNQWRQTAIAIEHSPSSRVAG